MMRPGQCLKGSLLLALLALRLQLYDLFVSLYTLMLINTFRLNVRLHSGLTYLYLPRLPISKWLSCSAKGKKEKDPFGKIDEFNADLWGSKTDQWMIGAVGKGFDSMGIMQPLIDIASNSNVKVSWTHSCLKATRSRIGPLSQS